ESVSKAAVREVRLGIILAESELLSEEVLNRFLSEFGHQHCFILNKHGSFQLLTSTGKIEASYESLPIDYLYQPDIWDQRLTEDHLRNALLCLANVDLDFVIVSPSLCRLPQIAVSSIRNHL